MTTLDALALRYGTDKASTHHDYCQVYEHYLASRRGDPVTLLELGVHQGASLLMWRDYFSHPDARVYGVDVTDAWPGATQPTPRITTWRADATHPPQMEAVVHAIGRPLDIVVDDASHLTADQIRSWALLWSHLAPGGLYCIEDVCCAYWPEYAHLVSFGFWLQQRVDDVMLHGARRHGDARRFEAIAVANPLSAYERTIAALHVHNSLIVFEKR